MADRLLSGQDWLALDSWPRDSIRGWSRRFHWQWLCVRAQLTDANRHAGLANIRRPAMEKGTLQMTSYALVTGASRNIGRAIAERLTDDGYTVLMLDKRVPEGPCPGEFRQVDLSDAAATTEALQWALDGRNVTRLVNCAGIVDTTPLEALEPSDFDRVVALNTRAYVQTTQALAVGMKAAGFGRIVNIASRAALGVGALPLYSLSKGAVVTFTKTTALSLAPHGITCNAVSPGPIETDLMREVYPVGSDKRAKYLPTIPVQRFGTTDDVAEVVSFFLSDQSGFVTGQNLNVCGGLTVGLAHTV